MLVSVRAAGVEIATGWDVEGGILDVVHDRIGPSLCAEHLTDAVGGCRCQGWITAGVEACVVMGQWEVLMENERGGVLGVSRFY